MSYAQEMVISMSVMEGISSFVTVSLHLYRYHLWKVAVKALVVMEGISFVPASLRPCRYLWKAAERVRHSSRLASWVDLLEDVDVLSAHSSLVSWGDL